jgi:hypothetical protein
MVDIWRPIQSASRLSMTKTWPIVAALLALPSMPVHAQRHSECVAVLRRTGSIEATYDHIIGIADDEHGNNAFARIALFLGEANNAVQAVRFCVAISRPLDRAFALSALGEILAQNQAMTEARWAFAKADQAMDAHRHGGRGCIPMTSHDPDPPRVPMS